MSKYFDPNNHVFDIEDSKNNSSAQLKQVVFTLNKLKRYSITSQDNNLTVE